MATITFGGQPCIDPRSVLESCQRLGYPTDWWGKPNSWINPDGVDSGIGWILLTRASLNALGLNTPQTLTFAILPGEQSDGNTPTVSHLNLHIVEAVCITPGLRGDPNACYLVRLGDVRRLARAAGIDRAYNTREAPGSDTYYNATLNGGSPWTWDQMTQDVWQSCPQLGSYPGLPFTPDGTPEGFFCYGRYALDALGIILDRLSCTLVLNTQTNTFSIVQLTGTPSASDTAALTGVDGIRLFDEDSLDPTYSRIPETLRVFFPKSRPSPTTTGDSPWYSVDQADPNGTSPGVVSGTVAVVYDDLSAVYDDTDTLQNPSDLGNRAADRAADFFRKLRMQTMRRVYILPDGGLGLAPGGYLRVMRWSDTAWKESRPGFVAEAIAFHGQGWPGMCGWGSMPGYNELSPFDRHLDGGPWMGSAKPARPTHEDNYFAALSTWDYYRGNINDEQTAVAYAPSGIGAALSYTALQSISTGTATASDAGLPSGSAPVWISLWFNATSLSGSQNLLSYGTSTHGIFLTLQGSTIQLSTGSSGGTLSGGSLSTSTWYNVIATFDGTTWTLYLGGTSVATGTPTTATALSGTLTIGGVAGNLTDVRIYSRALSSADAATVWNNGVPNPSDCSTDNGLVLQYLFGEGSGTTTADLSNLGRTATLSSSGLWDSAHFPTGTPTVAPQPALLAGSATVSLYQEGPGGRMLPLCQSVTAANYDTYPIPVGFVTLTSDGNGKWIAVPRRPQPTALAIALSGIPAATVTLGVTTPGSETVALWGVDPVSGALVDLSMTATAYNKELFPVPVNAFVVLTKDGNGNWIATQTLAWTQAAFTTSTITARSGTTAGSGTATIYSCTSGTGALVATTASVTVYNLGVSAIPSSMFIELAWEPIGGVWLARVADGISPPPGSTVEIDDVTYEFVTNPSTWEIDSGITWTIGGTGTFTITTQFEICGIMSWCRGDQDWSSTTSVDNWIPPAKMVVDVIAATGTGTILKGITKPVDSGSNVIPRVFVLYNGSDEDPVIVQDLASGTAGNSITTPNGADFYIGGGESAFFCYDPGVNYWTVFSGPEQQPPLITASTSGTYTADLRKSDRFELTMTGDTELATSNALTGAIFTVDFIQDSGGGHAITFAFTAKWDGGSAPTFTTTGSTTTCITFKLRSDGDYDAIMGGTGM